MTKRDLCAGQLWRVDQNGTSLPFWLAKGLHSFTFNRFFLGSWCWPILPGLFLMKIVEIHFVNILNWFAYKSVRTWTNMSLQYVTQLLWMVKNFSSSSSICPTPPMCKKLSVNCILRMILILPFFLIIQEQFTCSLQCMINYINMMRLLYKPLARGPRMVV